MSENIEPPAPPPAPPPPAPPEDLPIDAASFWESTPLPPRPESRDLPSALERLGASPFPKSRFPFLGFLATVYDQVATSVKGR